jgi:hypothetical protein
MIESEFTILHRVKSELNQQSLDQN